MKKLNISPKRKKVLEELEELKARNGCIQSHSSTPIRGLDIKRVEKPKFTPFSIWEYRKKIQ